MDVVFFVCLWGTTILTIEGFSRKFRAYSNLVYGRPDFYVNTLFHVHFVANKVKNQCAGQCFQVQYNQTN